MYMYTLIYGYLQLSYIYLCSKSILITVSLYNYLYPSDIIILFSVPFFVSHFSRKMVLDARLSILYAN